MGDIYINGKEVDYFNYNGVKGEIEAVDAQGKVITGFPMTKKQFTRLQKSHKGWAKLKTLFGDKED